MKIINKRCNKLLVILVILFTFTFVYCTNGANYFNDYVEATYISELNDIKINEESESNKFNLFTVSNKLSSQDTKELPPNYSSQSLIEINSNIFVEDNISVGDTIGFEIPEVGIYEAIIDKVSVDVNNILSYRALIKGSEYSYIIISINDNILTANINLIEENKIYTITFEKRNNNYYLNNIDDSNININMCEEENSIDVTKSSSNNEFSAMGAASSYNLDEEVTIDVMFVYTKDAEEWANTNVGSIDLAISNALENSQLVLDNSEVGINLRMVHSEQVNYVSSNNTGTDLYNITFTKGKVDENGYMDEVHEWRDEYGADLVVLIGNIYNDAGGRAWRVSSLGNSNYGFSVVRITSLNYVLIHELGHNMGSHHSRNQKNNPAPANGGAFEYSTGWRWVGNDGVGYVSVMTYNEGDKRAPLFSNPNISWQRQPTGSYYGQFAPADNARSLKQMKNVIASYRLDAGTGNQLVNINDPNLLTAISNKLNKSAEEINKQDMAKLVELKLNRLNIIDLNGLEYAINLRELNLAYNLVNDLSSLSELKVLQRLNLYNNNVEDIKSLCNITSLESLALGRNKFNNLKDLENLINLKELHLTHNNIEDISILRNLVNLKRLELRGNKIKDISSLSNMVNLKLLDLDSNKIKDISSIVKAVENRVSTDYLEIFLNSNYLDIKDANLENMKHINKLKQYEDVILHFDRQRDVNVKVYLDENEVNIKKDMNYELKTSLTPENAYNKNMIWSSSDENIVTVNENGLIKGINTGTAIITVEMEDGGYYDTCEVTVIEPNVGVTTEEDTPVNGRTVGTDTDVDKLTYSKDTDPQNGVVTLKEDGTWLYTPNNDFSGIDKFKVKVEDGNGDYTIVTEFITVSPINDSPAIPDYDETIEEDKQANGKVIGTDVDGDKLTYSKDSDPQNGEVTVEEDGTWVYTPKNNYNGEDVFKVKVEDGNGGFAISTIKIKIIPVDDPPVFPDYDLNDDNVIDNKDMVILAKYYGIKSEDQSYNSYFDYNSDNIIDLLDIVLLSKQIIKD